MSLPTGRGSQRVNSWGLMRKRDGRGRVFEGPRSSARARGGWRGTPSPVRLVRKAWSSSSSASRSSASSVARPSLGPTAQAPEGTGGTSRVGPWQAVSVSVAQGSGAGRWPDTPGTVGTEVPYTSARAITTTHAQRRSRFTGPRGSRGRNIRTAGWMLGGWRIDSTNGFLSTTASAAAPYQ
jgi:hypothetical protein